MLSKPRISEGNRVFLSLNTVASPPFPNRRQAAITREHARRLGASDSYAHARRLVAAAGADGEPALGGKAAGGKGKHLG